MFAYILISLSEPNEREVLDNLTSFDEVVDANLLFGEWDVIIKIKIDSTEDVTKFVIDKLRNMSDIRLTSTLIVAE